MTELIFYAIIPVTIALLSAFLLTQQLNTHPYMSILVGPFVISMTLSYVLNSFFPLMQKWYENVRDYVSAAFGLQVDHMAYLKFAPPIFVSVVLLIVLAMMGVFDATKWQKYGSNNI